MSKILIIDDEVQIRTLLARMLGLEGYEVCQAGDCKTAIWQLEVQSPDVALCDVFLPDGNGVDLVLTIKKTAPNVEVILLTAHGNIPDGVQAIKNGAFDYITKGDDNNKIIPLISRAVEKAKMNVRLEKLESEMFGHKADSFTGAMKDKKGLFEEASNGTIFLDEIGEMAFELAAMERRHIARVLEYTKGNKTETARLLKIGLTTLYRKIEEYKI